MDKKAQLWCVAALLSVAIVVAAVAGFSIKVCAVTFRQEGQPDIVRTVLRWGELKDVPKIEQKTLGYTTTWNVDDFSHIKGDMLVETVTGPSKYNIIYDTGKEEAVIDTTTQEVTYGTSYTLPRPTCAGYTFGKWVIQHSSTEVRDGVYEFNSDLPLSAVWIPHEFTITYETNKPQAEIAKTKQRALYGEPCELENPTCEGFVFQGWQIKGTEDMLASGDRYPEIGDITLSALWKVDGESDCWLSGFESSGASKNVYTVTFRQEGKEDIVRTVSEGEVLQDVPKLTPITGYRVMWSMNDFTSISNDTLVVAIKHPRNYTITYEKGFTNAKIAKTKQVVIYGEPYILEIPSCEGYTFQGWRIKGTKAMMKNSAKYFRTDNITLEAVWKQNDTTALWYTDFEFEGSQENRICTVTFRQDGYDNIVREVAQGTTLTDIPKLKAVEGYNVIWSVVGLDQIPISGDMIVVAVKIPQNSNNSTEGIQELIENEPEKAAFVEEEKGEEE